MGKRRPRKKGASKRAYLKRFSAAFVKVGTGVNLFQMKDVPAFHYTQRARSLGVDEHFMTALNRLFGLEVRTGVAQKSPERLAVEERIREYLHGVPPDRCVRLVSSPIYSEKLYFNDDLTKWWIVEEQSKPIPRIRETITYGKRETILLKRLGKEGGLKWCQPYYPTLEKVNGD